MAEYKFTTAIQRKILALLWLDSEYFSMYRGCIKPQYFSKAIDIDICRVLIQYWDKYNKPPTQDVLIEEIVQMVDNSKSKVKQKDQYLEAISQIADMEGFDYEYIKDKVVDFGRKQAMSEAIMEAAEIIQGGDVDKFSEVESLIQTAQMVGQDTHDIGIDFWEDTEDVINSYNEEDDVIERFPTGMTQLDYVLKGGLGRTEMGVILAPPGKGKSTALLNFGSNALRDGKTVVHISFENNAKQTRRNYHQSVLKRSLDWIKENPEKAVKTLNVVKEIAKGQLFIKKFPTKSADINDIRMYLRRLVNIKNVYPDMIIVDYGTIMKPLHNYADKRNNIESNFEDLRALADEFNAALWTAAQGNRGSLSKKVVTKADLAEAFAIANTADVLIALCQTLKEKAAGIMRGFVDKNRDSADSILLSGTINYDNKQITFDKDITDSIVGDDDKDESEEWEGENE